MHHRRAASLAFLAFLWLCFVFDNRWSSFEIPMQTVTLGLVLVAAVAVLERHDLTGPTAAVRTFPFGARRRHRAPRRPPGGHAPAPPAPRAAQPPVQR
ncbi:MAG TPA: hypothetical protein VGR26_13320 [Acidimicrobiales bacterium]|nr:hypothetical protein [Acidimicrobiales bacterium]